MAVIKWTYIEIDLSNGLAIMLSWEINNKHGTEIFPSVRKSLYFSNNILQLVYLYIVSFVHVENLCNTSTTHWVLEYIIGLLEYKVLRLWCTGREITHEFRTYIAMVSSIYI